MTSSLSIVEWLVLALAVFRLVRLMLFDTITRPVRSYFLQENDEEVIISGSGWRFLIGYLLTCHWCAGIWCGSIVATIYLLAPWTFPLWLGLSLASISSLLHEWLET